ncbi:MAG: pilus assembly protein TadG-related protein, partial [Pararhodobacter sp.]
MMTVMLPVMILGMGLGAETGFQYMTQRKLQHSADMAAHAGAARLRAGDTPAQIVAAATHVAEHGGFQTATGTITVHTPPVTGSAAGDARSVEIILNHVQQRFFSLLVSQDPVPIS